MIEGEERGERRKGRAERGGGAMEGVRKGGRGSNGGRGRDEGGAMEQWREGER